MTKATAQKATQWIDVGPLDSIPIRGARVVKAAIGCIAVFRTTENQAFALLDQCPHKGGPLSQGIVHDKGVTCPLHNWVIDLQSGAALGADTGTTPNFSLRIENGRILLDATEIGRKAAA